HNHTSSVIGEFGVLAAAVVPNDVGKILNRPGLQQGDPMPDTHDGPARNDSYQLRPAHRCRAKQLRKPQVVANERRNGKMVPLKGHNVIAGGIILAFAAQVERLHLAIARNLDAIRREYHCFISAEAITSGDNARYKVNSKFFG